MSSPIRNVSKHTFVYGLGIVAGKLASFIMLPIYTHFLTPSDYGILELLSMTIDVIGMIAGIGLASGIFKFYAEYDDPVDKNEVISTAFLGAILLAITPAALGILFSPYLSRTILGTGGNPQYFRLFFLIYVAQSATLVPFLFIRALQKSWLFVTLSVGQLFAMLSLNIYFVVVRGAGVEGVLISNLIATTAIAVVTTAFLVHRAGLTFSVAKFKQMARFGYPLIFWSLGSFALNFSDRYFLNHFTDQATVGIYSLGYKFGFILSAFAFTPFVQVWAPMRFEIAKQRDAQQTFRRVFFYLNVGLFSLALGISLFVRDVLSVMAAPAFITAYKVVPLVLVATILNAWSAFCNLGLQLKARTGLQAWASVASVVAVLGLNLFLIPRYGMFGAAWATMSAFAIRFALVYAFSQRLYFIDYDWSRSLRLVLIVSGMFVFRSMAGDLSLPASLGLGSILLLLTGVLVYGWLLTADEREGVRNGAARLGSVMTMRSGRLARKV